MPFNERERTMVNGNGIYVPEIDLQCQSTNGVNLVDIISTIETKQATVGVVGLGYVGLPLVLCFAEKGFPSVGFDTDTTKINALSNGRSYIKHIPSSRVEKAVAEKRFIPAYDFSKLSACDAILIAVPTPLNKNREPDISFVASTCETLAHYLRKGQLVVLESTTYPGTTEEIVVPTLERSGLKVDQDFFVAYSPEREDPNNPQYSTETIPKIIGSTSPAGLTIAEALYRQIVVQTVPVSSTRVAEATKLVENIFRSVNIALVNELKMTFMRMGIDIWEVIEAAKTKPFGYMPFYPGPGLGGHCIPIDPFYLTWKAREYGLNTRFVELAGEINTRMPEFVVMRTAEALNSQGKPVKGSRILCLGVSYKPDLDDVRESPAFEIMTRLQELGAAVAYHDPYVPVIPPTRNHARWAGVASVPYNEETIRSFDVVLILTHHKVVDYEMTFRAAPLIVDTRGVMKQNGWGGLAKVWMA